jgi:hypothetical protein
MRNTITVEEIIEQINDIDLSIKNLKKNIKTIKYNKNKNEKDNDIKRPLNSYMVYYTENYQNIKRDNPEFKSKEIAKVCGGNWKNMKPNEKHKYENKAKKNKERYEKSKSKSDNIN